MDFVFFVLSSAAGGIVYPLYLIPCAAVDDRFVRVFADDLFVFGNADHCMVFIGKAGRAVLYERTDIGFVSENVRNRGKGARRTCQQLL